jgi:hypothetical protein
MHNEIVIDISGEGRVSALHMDEFPLSFLGKMQVSRASSIEFDEESQTFYVVVSERRSDWQRNWIRSGGAPLVPDAAKGFTGYDEARLFEVDWLQKCALEEGCDPLSINGIAIAGFVRADRK